MASYCKGTVVPASGFSAEKAAEKLRKAMKGLGTDEGAIIDVFSQHSNEQRQEIIKSFKTQYGKDLKAEIKSEISGNFEDVIVDLMYTPVNYDAKILRDAIKGAGTDEMALIEVLCTRSNAQIQQIKDAYKTLYKDVLEKDVVSDTSGCLQRLLVSQLQANRNEDGCVDQALAAQEAEELFKAGADKVGTDESTFNRILSLRSYTQLCATFDAYRANHGKEIETVIKAEFSGFVEEGFLAIAKCARNVPGFFAERLYSSMKGAGTKDKVLKRILVSRCEVDMEQIKEEFQKKYGKTLISFIKGDTGGDYKKILCALCGEPRK